ncbi:MAG: DUF3179 domain-containing protein [Planctomycetes bacterium]|nr:DUF3179 domain-containing protein [Planctomycetota bacterium]
MTAPRNGFPTLTFRGGGWVIVAAAVLLLAFLAWALSGVFLAERPGGRGTDPANYGFVLEPLLVDRAMLVGSGNSRDFLAPLDRPAAIRGSEVLRWNQEHRMKLLVSTDRVAGIVVNGEARAYPLAILNAHEVVNDVVGGVPVAITYSPLTDSLVAFDRRVGGRERTFRVSGLLSNANLVMYDVVEEAQAVAGTATPGAAAAAAAGSSLWSQLEMRAIAGPAAAEGLSLTALPDTNITSWRLWLAAWPDTQVATGDPSQSSRYKEFSYARYFLTPRVEYPVKDLVPAVPEPQTPNAALEAVRAGGPRSRKTAVVEVREGDDRTVLSVAEMVAGATNGIYRFEVGSRQFEATVQDAPLAVLVRAADGKPAMVVARLWFAGG